MAVPNSSAFLSLARKGRRREKKRKKEFERDLFFRSASLHSSRFFPTANVWGRKNGWNWYAWRILGQAQCPSLHPRENLSSRDLAGCKTSRRLSLNPATSTRGAKERKRGGGSFLFCRNYFPGRASCLIFPRRHPPAFSPRHLASAASDVFGKLVQFPAASMTRLVSETLRGRRAQECFLPSASCRLSSHLSLFLSLSPFFEREERGCWLVSSSPFFLFRMRAVDARNSRKPRCRKCSCATTGAKLSSTLVSFRLPRRASASLDGFIVRTGVKARRLKSGGISPLLSVSLFLCLSSLSR